MVSCFQHPYASSLVDSDIVKIVSGAVVSATQGMLVGIARWKLADITSCLRRRRSEVPTFWRKEEGSVVGGAEENVVSL